MDLSQLKKEYVLAGELGVDESFGKILTVIDFGNVDYWFEEDRQDAEHNPLQDDEKLAIDLKKLHDFCSLFSDHVRFYYGHDPESLAFLTAARHVFGKNRVFTKQIQKVRHYLRDNELASNTRATHSDGRGTYIHIPKCNFDVEIAVDTIRLVEMYDTLALFSGDADFVSLARYIRKSGGKKVILVKAGHITSDLRNEADKVINAQDIKPHITRLKKRKPGARPGSANL